MMRRNAFRLLTFAAIALTVTGIAVTRARAGGPLLLGNDGQPVLWSKTEVRGGPLNLDTVDANGVVQYRVDSGPLGTLSNQQAVALADRIFNEYSSIPTSTIRFHDAGPILDPDTGQPVDVNGSNVGKFLGNTPTNENPIIFDSDGAITGGGGVLGFFGFLNIDFNTPALDEAYVVLNGRALTGPNALTTTSFLGVFTHEFGHFAGPLDHEQINGYIGSDDVGAVLPTGFSSASAYDLYAPFTETMYPFLYPADPLSQLGALFPDSGYFIATLDMDTQNALSDLYPTAAYLASTGSIQGTVTVNTSDGPEQTEGINVIARRISEGAYPPSLGTPAFTAPPAVDSAGVPQAPQAAASTDSLATVSSAVTGLQYGLGTYKIQGLPPGQYVVEVQQINPFAIGGSSIGQLTFQATLPAPEQYYEGPGVASTSPAQFMPVTVTAGQVTSGVDFTLASFTNTNLTEVTEIEPNFKKGQAQTLPVPCDVTGSVADTEKAKLAVLNPDGTIAAFIQDLYRLNVTSSGTYFVALDGVSGSPGSDIDLYLFDSQVSKKKTSFSDSHLRNSSLSPTVNEQMWTNLKPGVYYIGVSAFTGSENYKLKVIRP